MKSCTAIRVLPTRIPELQPEGYAEVYREPFGLGEEDEVSVLMVKNCDEEGPE